MIDTHSHLYSTEFHEDLADVVASSKAVGVDKIYLPAIDSSTHEAMMLLAKQQQGYCIPMMGLHPCYVDGGYEKELELVEAWLKKEKFVAIGEIGLDYYHSTEFKDQQIDALERQIRMAMERDLPIIIHTRSSMDDCIKIIEEVGGGNVKGIFHCFGGDERQARKIIEMGFMLGIGGVVTYKNAGLAKIVEAIPLESIVLETDAPYLTPVPFRGKRNETSYIKYVAEKIAEIKGIEIKEVDEITTANAKKIFSF
jgi:TatD DNase family protein